MAESKKARLSKFYLSAQSYKGKPVYCDITDFFEKNDIRFIEDVSTIEKWDVSVDGKEYSVPQTMFVLHPSCSVPIEEKILQIIDASIVNSTQAKAVKQLIHGVFLDFENGLWSKTTGKGNMPSQVDTLDNE